MGRSINIAWANKFILVWPMSIIAKYFSSSPFYMIGLDFGPSCNYFSIFSTGMSQSLSNKLWKRYYRYYMDRGQVFQALPITW